MIEKTGVQVEQENYAIKITIFLDGIFLGKGLTFFYCST